MHANPNNNTELLKRTSEIISAYAGNNMVGGEQLPDVIGNVFNVLSNLGQPKPSPVPAVPINMSISQTGIACLECGKKLKLLKVHIAKCHDLAPDQYRAKWKLRSDYPMVAPDYSIDRQIITRGIGFGPKAKT